MSFLKKIRENTRLIFFFTVISLLFFILDPNFIFKFFNKNSKIIGKVNGENIYEKDYIDCLKFLKWVKGSSIDNNIKNDAWKLMVNEKLLTQKSNDIGINNVNIDFWDAIKTQSIYSTIDQFRDDEGIIDLQKIKNYINSLEKSYSKSNVSPQVKFEKSLWDFEKKNIQNKILAKKYVEMLVYGLNASKKEVQLNQKNKKFFSIIDYFFIPYPELEKKYNIFLSKNDIYHYINQHKFLYKKENLRNLSFLFFRTNPSLKDKKDMDQKMINLFNKLKYKNQYYNFISNNSERDFDKNYYTVEYLPPILKSFVIKNPKIGSMLGPLKEKNIYFIAKLTDKKKIFDSVLISHILFSHRDSKHPLNFRKKEEAKKIAKKIYNKIIKNPKIFYDFIKKSDIFYNSKKTNSSLGWIKYNGQKYIDKFDVFSTKNKIGSIGLIETNFGYHIIRIDNKKNIKNAYQLGIIVKSIKPSNRTKKEIYKKMNDFLLENKNSNLNQIINNAINKKIEVIFLEEIKDKQWDINGLNTELDQDIINWSFNKERKKGDKKVFKTLNQDYIVSYLSDIQYKGIPNKKIDESIVSLMNQKIYNILSKKFINKNLEYIASHFYKKIKKSCKINFYNSTIDHYQEPKVIGSAFSLKLNQSSQPIFGNRGVFFIRVKKRFYYHKNNLIYDQELNDINNFLRKKSLEKLNQFLLEKSDIKDLRKEN